MDDPITRPAAEWFSEHVSEAWHVEKIMVNKDLGYGCTVDLVGRLFDGRYFVLDYKTQAVKGKSPNKYDTWAYQLAAQGQCLPELPDVYINLVINTIEPYRVWAIEHKPEKIETGMEIFTHALQLWRLRRNIPYRRQD